MGPLCSGTRSEPGGGHARDPDPRLRGRARTPAWRPRASAKRTSTRRCATSARRCSRPTSTSQVVKDFLARVKERVARREGRRRGSATSSGRARCARRPASTSSRSARTSWSTLMGPVDTTLAPRRAGRDLGDAARAPGRRQDDRRREARAATSSARGARPLLVAADIYRPAAVLQLQQLGARIDVAVHVGARRRVGAGDLRSRAAERARREGFDAIVYDTAGRLAIDDELMQELEEIRDARRAGQHAARLRRADGPRRRQRRAGLRRAAPPRRPDPDQARRRRARRRGARREGGRPASRSSSSAPASRSTGSRPSGPRASPRASSAWATSSASSRTSRQVVDAAAEEAEEDAERILQRQLRHGRPAEAAPDDPEARSAARRVREAARASAGLADQVDEGELGKVEAMIQSMTRDRAARPRALHRQRSRASRIARGSGRAAERGRRPRRSASARCAR